MNITDKLSHLNNLKICILNSDNSKSASPNNQAFPLDPRVFLPNSNIQWDLVFVDKANIFAQINKLKYHHHYDLFFNLCCGAVDSDVAGYEVIRALEYYKLAYTGADEKASLLKKSAMKMVCHGCDISMPDYFFVHNDQDIELANEHLRRYPMFVKPFNGRDSVGITAHSKVDSFEAMKLEAEKMIADFGGALVEEYIAGREFTVLVVENEANKYEPFVLDPVEFEFCGGEGFLHFDAKRRLT